MKSLRLVLVLLFSSLMIFVISCGKKSLQNTMPPEERMAHAMELFDKGDYMDARNQYKIITLSNSGSVIADKAQYYLAECHYKLKEYILSASEYERMMKVYPNSEWVDDAKFKVGMSYYELSPKYSLDQDYTQKAIKEFQEFLEDYPSSNLFKDVEAMLDESRGKLAKKLYAAADQYRRIRAYEAGAIYFNLVLERYYDSEFAAEAQFYLGECYGKLEKNTQALEAYEMFVKRYPEHKLLDKARGRIADLSKTNS